MSNLYLFPLSDLHLGSNHCDLSFFDYWCKKFESAPDNKAIYLLGDLLEFPSTHVDAYDIAMNTHDALETLIELLEPYKEYIRWVCTGNHEARSLKEYSYDITKQIASRLNANYTRNDFFDKIIEGEKEFIVYGKHGTKVSKSPLLAMNNFVSDMNHINADLYMQGHNHYSAFYSQCQRGYDEDKRASYLFSGHFLDYKESYAHNKGLLMSPPSFSRLKIDKNLHISCDTFYADEVN